MRSVRRKTFSLLSVENNYRIAQIHEFVGRKRLTDSLNSSAKNFAHDCLPFLKKEFYGEIPNLISKRSDGRTRWRMGGGWSRRTRGNRRSKSRRRICLRRRYRRSGPAGARLGRWHVLRRRILVGASAQWRLHGARTTLSRRGYRVGRAHREGLPLPPRATSVRVRSRFLRSMVPLSLVPAEQPNKALEPTPVGAFSSAFAVDITSPAWLSLSRSRRKPATESKYGDNQMPNYTRRPLRTTFTVRS